MLELLREIKLHRRARWRKDGLRLLAGDLKDSAGEQSAVMRTAEDRATLYGHIMWSFFGEGSNINAV